MRPLVVYVVAAWAFAYGQPPERPAFEVASVKPASPDARAIECSGGPGTSSPGIWRCSNVPLSFVITHAYGFEAYQFPPNAACCRDRFDFTARLPERTTKAQFQQMLQRLLAERFRLALHHERKEMPVFELAAGEHGVKMKPSRPDASAPEEDPWDITPFTIGEDGYPVFPPGRSGLQGMSGHYRWTGFQVSMPQICTTLSFHLGRPVIDVTGLTGKYDINMTWSIDLAWILENSGHRDLAAELPDTGPAGPSLSRAVQDQLGLKLNAKQGPGDIVVIDHVEKIPVGN